MSARPVFLRARAPLAIRLFGWMLVLAVCGFLLWIVLAGAGAHADPGSGSGAGDPKAAARAIGNAGNAAARTIARDASNAADVPGYAGTNVPERSLTASGMENAARARLADPDDPGGAAGRAVVRGTTQRPARPVAASDPEVLRSETIVASPQSSAHRADGLASGSTTDCGADLQDAQDGGSCGRVTYCVGAGCETVPSQANTGFVEATTRLNMALELGGEEFDRQDMRFFTGQRRGLPHQAVRPRQLLQELGASRGSRQLLGLGARAGRGAQRRQHPLSRPLLLEAHLLRRLHPPLKGLVRVRLEARAHPAAAGPSAARHRLGKLPGFTVAEVESIDFASLDLSEFTQDLMDGSREPSVSLPDAGNTGDAMRTRIRDFYRRGQ